MKKSITIITVISVYAIFLIMAIASAPQKATVNKYDGVFKLRSTDAEEIVKNDAKLQFLKTITSPTIVLRVPTTNRDVLGEDKSVKAGTNNNISQLNPLYDGATYNIIEKELLKGGFTVRDRALFAKVLDDKNVQDYSKIKELTETDLILELSNIEYVPYRLNSFSYFTKGRKNAEKENVVNCNNNISLYGIKLEFRLIKVKDNDFIGSFTYNCPPYCFNTTCSYGVDVTSTNNYCSEPYIMQGAQRYSGIYLLPKEYVDGFIRTSTQKLVGVIMKN
ncbi:MAG: hypothetical protein KGO81_06380 [Bacteroidota bacterium]|nr:hypothetical protein [Bacteroidota bacterium]